MIGETFGHYRIESKLGEGGMGVVYCARDTHLDRLVAIKVLPAEAVANPDRKRRFVQEAKAASALNHPNIIHIYDIDVANGVDFIAMEYVPGKTLAECIGRKGLSLNETLNYAVQIADALAKAHSSGIVHRDLKPANIMVNDGHVKVLDFGLAKLTQSEESDEFAATVSMKPELARTEEGAIVGTVAYMSPEQAEAKKVDARSDIFSFGAILYEMITGRRAFEGGSRISTLSAILHQEPKPVREISEGVPAHLEWIVSHCLRKDPGRRFQDMADLKVALQEIKEDADSGRLFASPPSRFSRFPLLPIAGILCVTALAATGLFWWLRGSPRPATGALMTRLTSDSGLTTDPALSLDGTLLAYASDRSGEGHLDIYVLQPGGVEPIRLTRHELDDSQPAFSPDGTRIAFRSDRDGGGIYVVSTLGGGEERLLAKYGRRPRFSPDGSQILYWVGEYRSAKMYVIPAAGGSPRQLQPDFESAIEPIWTPDGKHVLFAGARKVEQEFDWWVFRWMVGQPERRKPGPNFVLRASYRTPFPPRGRPQAMRSYFLQDWATARTCGKIPFVPKTWQTTGSPRRITFGSGMESQPSAVVAGLVFSGLSENFDIWSLPLDANRGKVTGELRHLTQDPALDSYPSSSADGRRVVFESQRSGNRDIWLKHLESGKAIALAASAANEHWPKISADGTRVAYAVDEGLKVIIYVLSVSPTGHPGMPERVCEECELPAAWTPDSHLLLTRFSAPGLLLLDIGSREKVLIAERPKNANNLEAPSFSADGRWMSFVAPLGPLRRQIFVAPYRGKTVIPERDWTAITDGAGLDREPRWSPDGNLLYFLSERDGFRCFWAQPVNPTSKHPVGSPFAVHHFHSARFSIRMEDTSAVGFSVARDKIVFSMGETTGNIWKAKLEGQKGR